MKPTRKPLASAKKIAYIFIVMSMLFHLACGRTDKHHIQQEKADLIFYNGTIYTVDPRFPRVEAVSVKDGLILSVGEEKVLFSQRSPTTRMVDLKGKTLLPGLIDAHIHVIGLGRFLEELDLISTGSPEEMLERVKTALSGVRPGEWIRGRGWDQNKWKGKKFPDHRKLSELTPDNPVILKRVDGHAALVNARVLEICGITASTPDPPGGKILRFPGSGEPTGVLIDEAVSLMDAHIPEPGEETYHRFISRGVARCLAAGLTTVHDPGESEIPVLVLKEMYRKGEISLRIYVMLEGKKPVTGKYLSSGPEIGLFDHHLTIRCIKIYADGALGSRGAALLEPYSDDPANRGIVIMDEEEIYSVTKRALGAGFQVAVHAIGDRGNRNTLNAFERALTETGADESRLRVEHAQVLSPQDIPRFKNLGVIPSMQPAHCTSDMYWAGERLGPEREKGAYAWRSLLDLGARVPYGTDAPVESENPFFGFYAAITRQDRNGWPPGGWHPEQAMTREEALRSMTIDAAYAGFEEEIKGSITPGKLADLVILSKDIMKIPAAAILETQVMATIVGGRIAYKAPGFLDGDVPETKEGKI